MSLKSTISEELTSLQKLVKKLCKAPTTQTEWLREIYLWQEVSNIADKSLTASWGMAQTQHHVIPSDKELRKTYGPGAEAIVIASKIGLSMTIKTSQAPIFFNREEFIAAIAKKYKIKESDLWNIADNTSDEGTIRLTKRVLETVT